MTLRSHTQRRSGLRQAHESTEKSWQGAHSLPRDVPLPTRHAGVGAWYLPIGTVTGFERRLRKAELQPIPTVGRALGPSTAFL